jgi:hypothetical protein
MAFNGRSKTRISCKHSLSGKSPLPQFEGAMQHFPGDVKPLSDRDRNWAAMIAPLNQDLKHGCDAERHLVKNTSKMALPFSQIIYESRRCWLD